MGLILKIAWRNLWRHRGHSLVVGAILCLGAMFMTVGNAVVTGMDRGLQRTVVHGFTGDLVLVSDKHEGDNVFLEMGGKTLEPLYNFKDIAPQLEKYPPVESFLPLGKNLAMLLNEGDAMPSFLYLIGTDLQRYRRMFPDNLNMIEGRLPEPSKPWLLLPGGARKEIVDQTNVWFIPEGAVLDTAHLASEAGRRPGDLTLASSMVLMGFNEENTSTDIRLGVNGVFRYKALNTIFGHFTLVDIESYRQTLGYFKASDKTKTRLSGKDSSLFSMEDANMDDLFSGNSMLVSNRSRRQTAPAGVGATHRGAPTPAAVPVPAVADLDDGAYNLVMVMLRPGANAAKAKDDLNRLFRQKELGVRAVDWKQSLGPVGSMAILIKGALFVFVSILFVVAIIIIVNTLSMAALERTPEIGMMRAVGARKGFIGMMFLAETAVLSLTFGGLGVALGAGVVEILSLLKLSSENDMLQLFFGGDTFRPLLATGDFVLAFVQLAFVTLAAVLYPLWLARRVTPKDAVDKE